MALFTAYFDESGTHDDSRVVCVGGYVSTVGRWGQLGAEWKKMLEVAEVNVLHRVDLENFRGEFKGWNNARRKKLLNRANYLIRKYTDKAVFGTVVKKDFDQTVPGVVKRAMGGAYGWLVQEVMVGIGHWGKDRGVRDPVDYIFEAGAKGRRQVERMFDALYDDENPEWAERLLIGSWSFARKESVVQLQPADILAYEVYKHMLNRVIDGIKRDIRKSVKKLIRATDEGHYWDARRLIKWVANAAPFIEHLEIRERVLKEKGREDLI